MANRHDVIIWDADVYGTPKNFEEAVNMAYVLLEQPSATVSQKIKLFAQEIQQATVTNVLITLLVCINYYKKSPQQQASLN